MPTHVTACRARTPCNTPAQANKSSKPTRWAPAKQSLLYAFLAPFASKKGTPCNLTAMEGGRWLLPTHQWDEFYRLYASECPHVGFSLVQLSGDVFPLLIDVDTNKDPGAITDPSSAFFQVLSAFFSAIEDCGLNVSLLVPDIACFRRVDNLHVVFTTLHINKMQHKELRRRALKYLSELEDGVAHNWDNIVDQATTLRMPGSLKAKDGALRPKDGFYAPCQPVPPFDLILEAPLDQHAIQFASLWRPLGTVAHPHVPSLDPTPAPPPRTNLHPPDPIKDADLGRLCDLVHWNVRAASYPDWVRALTLFKEEGAARGDPDLYKVLAIERTHIPGVTNPGDGDTKWDQIPAGRAQRSLTFGTLHFWAKEDSPQDYATWRASTRQASSDLGLRAFLVDPDDQQALAHLQRTIDHAVDSPTHTSQAKVFVLMKGRDFVWVSPRKGTYFWFNGNLWVRQEEISFAWCTMSTTLTIAFKAAHNQLSSRILKADESQAEKLKKKLARIDDLLLNLEDAGKRQPILKEITMLLTDTDFPHKLDKQPDLFCFNDRVVDLRTKEVRSGRHQDFLTVSTGYDYPKQPNGLLPDIMRYFQQVLPTSEDRDYFLDQQAQRLSGHLHGQTFNIHTGVGSNGKSLTFGSLIKYVWGGYFGSLPIVALTNKRTGPGVASPELDKVRLSRRAVAVEPEGGLVLNCSLLKQLSGGDQVESRALYGQLVDYLPQYKVDLLCNNLPYLDGSDGGTKRRVRLQAWKAKFSFGLLQPDPDNHLYPAVTDQVLKDRMMAWRDDFVLHLIHRYDHHYIEMPPQTMVELSNEYLDENNPFAAFAQQFVDPSNQPGAYFTIKQAKLLWPLFQDFLQSQGRSRLPMPAEAEFRNALSSALAAPCHILSRVPGTQARQRSVFLAFKLRTTARDVEDAIHMNFDEDHPIDTGIAALTI